MHKSLPLERGPLTDQILNDIKAEDLRIGDAEAPESGGWDDDPDSDNASYNAYGVLVPATVPELRGPIGDSSSDAQVAYVINGYGLSRSHTERYMDHVRKVVVAMARRIVVLGDSSWKIQQVRCDSIGGVSRNDSIEPSEYSQTDVYVLYLSKEL